MNRHIVVDDGDFPEDPDFDPESLATCAYWRCGELFERRSANHRYCRKACRSRQKKWQRSQERKAAKQARRPT
ncbi:MAG: hypothetical protein GXP35_07010 [Actinobacteria bacterium]|nr:hypothetical protein [Actinomycetota bacterium]